VSAQIFDLGWRLPNVVDNEVPVPVSAVMRDQQPYRRMQVRKFVGLRRIRRNYVVAVERHAAVNVLASASARVDLPVPSGRSNQVIYRIIIPREQMMNVHPFRRSMSTAAGTRCVG
jgi:hypothetical protein